MPISLASFLIPKNGNTYFLVEDLYLKGGYQVRPDHAARDGINPFNRKEGMMVMTLDDHVIWVLQSDLHTWLALQTGGSGGSATADYFEYTSDVIAPNAFDVVEVGGAKTIMIQQLETSIPFTVEGFGNIDLVDSNPYKFISTDDHLSDDGTTLMSDGAEYKNRRFSFLSNDEAVRKPKVWFRLTNSSEVATSVRFKLWYLRIEE